MRTKEAIEIGWTMIIEENAKGYTVVDVMREKAKTFGSYQEAKNYAGIGSKLTQASLEEQQEKIKEIIDIDIILRIENLKGKKELNNFQEKYLEMLIDEAKIRGLEFK